MTMPERRVLTNAEADYLLGAAMGLAQGARLIPVVELVEHFEQRYQDAHRRGDQYEKQVALEELGFASTAQAFVRDAESLMEARRRADHAAATMAPAVPSECSTDPVDIPPSRRPLATDDAWVSAPPRAPR